MSKPDDARLYVGLMSGTSMDGIDAVLLQFRESGPSILGTHTHEIPPDLRRCLESLSQNRGTIDELGRADHVLGTLFSDAVHQLLENAGVTRKDIAAIGSHGQTVRHCPDGETPFSLQLADPNWIAEHTGITTVADFRRRDMAAGGEGAPLAPAFHQAVFQHQDEPRCILNIGGIANITWLPAGDAPGVYGFDSGPGNSLLDAWSCHCRNEPMDKDGAWASSGNVIPGLLQNMLEDPYFKRSSPKSTGKEVFNLAWIQRCLQAFPDALENDVQRTLLRLTALTISDQLPSQKAFTLYVCGGGAYNGALMKELRACCAPHRVATTSELGVAPEWVEGAAFAWLARQTLNGLHGNLPAVTGAAGLRTLGAIYPGSGV